MLVFKLIKILQPLVLLNMSSELQKDHLEFHFI